MSELQDRYEIQDLLYHYAELVDYGDNHRIADEIFAPDGCVDMGGAVIASRDALHGFYTLHPSFTKFPADLDGYRHDISNVRIRFHGADKAESNAHVTAWHWHKTERAKGVLRPADLIITGIYHDDFVRLPEGWRISRRRGGQSGTGIGAGAPPEAMKQLFSGLLGRIPTWGGEWIDTSFMVDGNE